MEITNKKVLADLIAEKNGMTKKAATETLDLVFDTIAETLKNGGKVDISGFGKFEVKQRPERKGINPATKEAITIAASKAPGFKAAKALKDIVK
ncbi:HU family DNA-binding protein [Anaerorhabdus sp.]|uniref:HU family DNA-binding protein n=1 Tax=Anaerorhabdus sp. TaxID=1872524 RepID=UPI002FCC826F